MYVALDHLQTETLREVLEAQLKQLRTESSRADSHDYREMLHKREHVIEQVLGKLADESARL